MMIFRIVPSTQASDNEGVMSVLFFKMKNLNGNFQQYFQHYLAINNHQFHFLQ